MVFGVTLFVLSATPVEAGELVRRAALGADHVEIVFPLQGDIAEVLGKSAESPRPPPKPRKPLVLVDHDRADVQTFLNLLETDTFIPADGTIGHLCEGWPIIRLSKGTQVLVELTYEHEALLSAPSLWSNSAELVPWAIRPLNAWFARHGFAFYEEDLARESIPPSKPTPGLVVIAAPKSQDEHADFLARAFRLRDLNAALNEAARSVATFTEPACDELVEPAPPLWATLLAVGLDAAPVGTADALESRTWKCPLDAAAAKVGEAFARERLPAPGDLLAVDRRTAAWILLRLESAPTRDAVNLAVQGLLAHRDPSLRRIAAAWLVRLGAPGPAGSDAETVVRLRKWWTAAAPRWNARPGSDAGSPR